MVNGSLLQVLSSRVWVLAETICRNLCITCGNGRGFVIALTRQRALLIAVI